MENRGTNATLKDYREFESFVKKKRKDDAYAR